MNPEEIIARLKIVLKHYSLTSSTFADTIDVQRSSISHLMSGRNKPSLDFILKVITNFPEVDLYWLLNGKGSFPKKEAPILLDNEVIKKTEKINIVNKEKESEIINQNPSLFSKTEEIQKTEKVQTPEVNINNNKKLIKVVLLYNDGSFEEFNK